MRVGVEIRGHTSQKASTPTVHHAIYTWSLCGSWVCGGWPSFRRYKRTPYPWIRKKMDGWWKTPTLEMVSP